MANLFIYRILHNRVANYSNKMKKIPSIGVLNKRCSENM